MKRTRDNIRRGVLILHNVAIIRNVRNRDKIAGDHIT